MEMRIQIKDYDPQSGFKYSWDYGFRIQTEIQNGEILIKANKAGLISLAKNLLSLAQDPIPAGRHLTLDSTNSLEEGAMPLIVEKD